MKKLITVFIAMVITVTSFSQRFSAFSLISNEKLDMKTEEVIEEINIFNISAEDQVVIHNRVKTDGECSSQIYKLNGYKDNEEGEGFTITFFFKSKLHDYELEVVENNKGVFIIGQGFVYQVKVYSLKTYK